MRVARLKRILKNCVCMQSWQLYLIRKVNNNKNASEVSGKTI